jgi:hypothetical protein
LKKPGAGCRSLASWEASLEAIYRQVDPSVVNIRVVEQVPGLLGEAEAAQQCGAHRRADSPHLDLFESLEEGRPLHDQPPPPV